MPFSDIASRLFGRRKSVATEEVPTLPVRLRRAQLQAQNMEMRSDVLMKRIRDLEVAAARKLKANNRPGAAMCLRQKKMLLAQHNIVQGQIINVTRSVLAMEQALATTATADCLQGSADALAAANAEHVDVDDVIEKFTEACDDTHDVAEQLAAPIGGAGAGYEDDDSLLAELDANADAVPAIATPAPAQPAAVTADELGMPEAPTGAISVEEEMRQLEREAMAT